MKQLRTQNLGINFLSQEAVDAMDSMDPTKLWFVPVECVIEAWISADGLSWYRKFSSGLVFQGGTVPATNVVVTLPTPFASTAYTIALGFTGLQTPDSGAYAYSQCGVKTQTSFFLRARSGGTSYLESCDWVAFGLGL